MNNIKSYTDLEVWMEARRLVSLIYRQSSSFPKGEEFGLKSQIRRAAVSIPSNIAEGCGRNYPKDSIQFFFIARGSIYELETQLYLSFDLGFIAQNNLAEALEKTSTTRKLLSGFIRYYETLK